MATARHYRVTVTPLHADGSEDHEKRHTESLREMPARKGTGAVFTTAATIWRERGSPSPVVVRVEEVKVRGEFEVTAAGEWKTLGKSSTRREAGSVTARSRRRPD